MHVALNAVFLAPPMGGVETYVRELCRGLLALEDAPRLTVLLNPEGHEALRGEDWAGGAELVALPRLGRSGVRAVSELSVLGAVADRHRADVVHSVAMTGPLASRARRVVTIPDTVWITHPSSGPTYRMWRAVVPRVARRAHRVIAISHAAGDELRTHLGVPAGRLDVVPLGFGTPAARAATPEEELRAGLGIAHDAAIVLNVGQKKAHRNLARLISALVEVRRSVPGAVLVMPGPPSAPEERELRAHALACGLPDRSVLMPGFLPQEDVEGLYAAAGAFVLPSLVEGFGLPVLEAMARGTPVACSDGSAPAEVAGDAAVLFDPRSVEAIAAATTRLLTDTDLVARLRAAGPVRASQFTWQRCAEGTMSSYRAALRARGTPSP